MSAEVVRHALEITRASLATGMHDVLKLMCECDADLAVFLIQPGGSVILATWLVPDRPLEPFQVLSSLVDRHTAVAAVVLSEVQWTSDSRAGCLSWCFPLDGIARSSFYVEEQDTIQELPDPEELVPEASLALWLEDRLELV